MQPTKREEGFRTAQYCGLKFWRLRPPYGLHYGEPQLHNSAQTFPFRLHKFMIHPFQLT